MDETPEEARRRIHGSRRTDMPHWNTDHLAAILGLSGQALGRLLNGVRYPSLDTVKKFELIFGWKATEQVDLIRAKWEEPDLRYGMVLHQVIEEWKRDNPRTLPAADLRCLVPAGNRGKRSPQSDD